MELPGAKWDNNHPSPDTGIKIERPSQVKPVARAVSRQINSPGARAVSLGTGMDPDSKVHGANMGPTWVMSAPQGLHVAPINLAIRGVKDHNSDTEEGVAATHV